MEDFALFFFQESELFFPCEKVNALLLALSLGYADTAFLATFTTDPGVPEGPIVWNETRVNPGGYYDNTTGIYTVPIDGIYEFTVQIAVIEDESLIYYILIDSVRVHYFNIDILRFLFEHHRFQCTKPNLRDTCL